MVLHRSPAAHISGRCCNDRTEGSARISRLIGISLIDDFAKIYTVGSGQISGRFYTPMCTVDGSAQIGADGSGQISGWFCTSLCWWLYSGSLNDFATRNSQSQICGWFRKDPLRVCMVCLLCFPFFHLQNKQNGASGMQPFAITGWSSVFLKWFCEVYIMAVFCSFPKGKSAIVVHCFANISDACSGFWK